MSPSRLLLVVVVILASILSCASQSSSPLLGSANCADMESLTYSPFADSILASCGSPVIASVSLSPSTFGNITDMAPAAPNSYVAVVAVSAINGDIFAVSDEGVTMAMANGTVLQTLATPGQVSCNPSCNIVFDEEEKVVYVTSGVTQGYEVAVTSISTVAPFALRVLVPALDCRPSSLSYSPLTRELYLACGYIAAVSTVTGVSRYLPSPSSVMGSDSIDATTAAGAATIIVSAVDQTLIGVTNVQTGVTVESSPQTPTVDCASPTQVAIDPQPFSLNPTVLVAYVLCEGSSAATAATIVTVLVDVDTLQPTLAVFQTNDTCGTAMLLEVDGQGDVLANCNGDLTLFKGARTQAKENATVKANPHHRRIIVLTE